MCFVVYIMGLELFSQLPVEIYLNVLAAHMMTMMDRVAEDFTKR